MSNRLQSLKPEAVRAKKNPRTAPKHTHIIKNFNRFKSA